MCSAPGSLDFQELNSLILLTAPKTAASTKNLLVANGVRINRKPFTMLGNRLRNRPRCAPKCSAVKKLRFLFFSVIHPKSYPVTQQTSILNHLEQPLVKIYTARKTRRGQRSPGEKATQLTLFSLPRVRTNFKFPLQPHQKYNTTRYEELSLLRGKKIILPILTTSLSHFFSKGWENVFFYLGCERVKWAVGTAQASNSTSCDPNEQTNRISKNRRHKDRSDSRNSEN